MSILLTIVYLEPSIVPGTVQSLNNCLIMNEVKSGKWKKTPSEMDMFQVKTFV